MTLPLGDIIVAVYRRHEPPLEGKVAAMAMHVARHGWAIHGEERARRMQQEMEPYGMGDYDYMLGKLAQVNEIVALGEMTRWWRYR